MSPKAAIGGLIWEFPKIIWPSFHPNSKFMFKFKPCILKHFTANYTPTGRAAFHNDPNPGAGENAPEGMNFRAIFEEIEFWQDGDFNNSNDPANVYTVSAR